MITSVDAEKTFYKINNQKLIYWMSTVTENNNKKYKESRDFTSPSCVVSIFNIGALSYIIRQANAYRLERIMHTEMISYLGNLKQSIKKVLE